MLKKGSGDGPSAPNISAPIESKFVTDVKSAVPKRRTLPRSNLTCSANSRRRAIRDYETVYMASYQTPKRPKSSGTLSRFRRLKIDGD